MKVLHISLTDSGGAGACARRISQSLRDIGVDSEMLVLQKKSQDNHVYACFQIRSFLYRLINKLLKILHLNITEKLQLLEACKKNKAWYSSPSSIYDVSNHPMVKEADIIHLHWINNFVDQKAFFKRVKKPIVWTLHDENLFLGIAHYDNNVDIDNKLEKKYIAYKNEMLKNVNNLGIIFLSQYFMRKFGGNNLIKNCPKIVINNSVDCKAFKPINRDIAKKKLGISQDTLVFSFMAASIKEKRKGLYKLISAIEELNIYNVLILAIGDDKGFEKHKFVKNIGKKNTPSKISEALSASDYFVMPSMQEAFSQAPLEAMACGIPVVLFPFSGSDELINDNNGVLCDGFDIACLVKGIKTAINNHYDKDKIRQDVIDRFSPNRIANQYLEFYKLIQSD